MHPDFYLKATKFKEKRDPWAHLWHLEMTEDGLLGLQVQLISGAFTVCVLRLYIFPSAYPNFFSSSLSCGVWYGSWKPFASHALNPCKIKSLLFQAYSNIQPWLGFIWFLTFPDVASLSHNSSTAFWAPCFLQIISLKSSLYRNWFSLFCSAMEVLVCATTKSGGLSVPPFPFIES